MSKHPQHGRPDTVTDGSSEAPAVQDRDKTATIAVDSEQLLNAPVEDPTAGFDLPGYVLTTMLGRGAYGQVWHAVRVGAGQDVAVKIFTSPGKLDWRYLQREVDRLLRVAEHPHIVTLMDANLQHQPPFYVMTLLRRGSLAELIRDKRPYQDLASVRQWFSQIVNALAFAHGKGLLHCDLKPGNVLLDEEGNARLVDFGQSQLRGEAANVLGTLNYMSPEQAVVAGENEVPSDPSVSWDIYSLGATIYALLSGSPPHAQSALAESLTSIQNVDQRLAQYRDYVLSTPARPLRELNPVVDRDLAEIIHHCILPEPQQRYHSVSEVADDLSRSVALLPLQAHPSTFGYRLQKFVRRNIGMVTIALTAVLALAIALATLTIQHKAELDGLKSYISELETRLQVSEQELRRLEGP